MPHHPHYDEKTGKWSCPESEAAYALGYRNRSRAGDVGSPARIRELEEAIFNESAENERLRIALIGLRARADKALGN